MKKIKSAESDWFGALVEDLKKLEFTGIVLTKWNTGKRLAEDVEKFGKPEYGKKRMENLAKELDTSKRELYRCVQFYEKCPSGTQLPNKSWRYIHDHMLPMPRREDDVEIAPLPKGKYNIIYADPPWNYYAGGKKNQSQHYDSITMDKLSEMPVEDLAADDCILFLWVTFPILPEALILMSQWGFNYSTVGFNWIKANKNGKGFFFGLGNWTRSNGELCLIGTKGSIERKDASISQIIYTPIGKHSEKPAEVRDKIVKLVGDLPRIELFARQKAEGWEVWGDEAPE